jgi:hypothetical protein
MSTSGSPFVGPINAAFHTSQSIFVIVPTNEMDETVQQKIHDHMRSIQKLFTERLPDREVKIVTDVVQMDLSQARGRVRDASTTSGRGPLSPCRSLSARSAGGPLPGSDLPVHQRWPHPQNPRLTWSSRQRAR